MRVDDGGLLKRRSVGSAAEGAPGAAGSNLGRGVRRGSNTGRGRLWSVAARGRSGAGAARGACGRVEAVRGRARAARGRDGVVAARGRAGAARCQVVDVAYRGSVHTAERSSTCKHNSRTTW
jgi:hypothetical protein